MASRDGGQRPTALCWKVTVLHHLARQRPVGQEHDPGRPGAAGGAAATELRRGAVSHEYHDESVTVTAQEQCAFTERLIAMGRLLQARATRSRLVVEGEVEDSLNGDTP